MDEETERTLMLSLVRDINDLFSSGLCTNPVVDRFLEDDVFGSEASSRQPLILIGASHLNQIAEYIDGDKWDVYNLSKPGFRVTESSLAELTSLVVELGKTCMGTCIFTTIPISIHPNFFLSFVCIILYIQRTCI
jgi:hypothetical protein